MITRPDASLVLTAWQDEAPGAARFHAEAVTALGLTPDDIAAYLLIEPDGGWSGSTQHGPPPPDLAEKVSELDPRLTYRPPTPAPQLAPEERERALAELADIDFDEL